MITLKQWMETVDYRITEGSDYGWQCYGHNAYSLDSWNGEQDGHSLTVIFDNKTQEVYEVQAHDYVNQRAYRLINPNYAPKHMLEATDRNIEDTAWDEVRYIDLETDDDWIEKAQAIVAGKDYDTRVSVPIDLTDEEMLKYMRMAHEMDVTFNHFVENALRHALEQHRG
jgi:hypothetical protein